MGYRYGDRVKRARSPFEAAATAAAAAPAPGEAAGVWPVPHRVGDSVRSQLIRTQAPQGDAMDWASVVAPAPGRG